MAGRSTQQYRNRKNEVFTLDLLDKGQATWAKGRPYPRWLPYLVACTKHKLAETKNRFQHRLSDIHKTNHEFCKFTSLFSQKYWTNSTTSLHIFEFSLTWEFIKVFRINPTFRSELVSLQATPSFSGHSKGVRKGSDNNWNTSRH